MTRQRRTLPPRPFRLASLILTRVYRSGCIAPERMHVFNKISMDILAALLPADSEGRKTA
jgi:hypothetical protein